MSGIILYIEHNLENLRLVQRAVEEIGLTLFCARSGADGLACVERLRPAVILIGLDLPDVDGFHLARALRRRLDEALHCVPIIAISAQEPDAGSQRDAGSQPDAEAERAIAAGCSVYLPRPLDIRRLWDLLERFLAAGDLG